MSNNTACPSCGCEVAVLLGNLGPQEWVRCRACHTERAITSIEVNDEDLIEADDNRAVEAWRFVNAQLREKGR